MQAEQITSQAGERTHTPGPWSVGHINIRDRGYPVPTAEIPIHVGPENNPGNCFCSVGLGGNGAISYQTEDILANARLIAAAPDLLAALHYIQSMPNDPRAHRAALDAIKKATF